MVDFFAPTPVHVTHIEHSANFPCSECAAGKTDHHIVELLGHGFNEVEADCG